MNISKEEVEHIASLARLKVAEGEKELFSEQLSQILTFVNQLQQVETEGIPQTASIVSEANILRDDIPAPCLPVDQAMANAPQPDDGLFVVPQIIQDQE